MRNDWANEPLGAVLKLSKQKHKPESEEHHFYVGLEHIQKHTGLLTSDAGIVPIKTVKNKFSANHILYGKLRPYLNKVYLAKESGVCSTDILVFEAESCVHTKFALLFMLSKKFVNDMSANTNGVNLPRVPTKFINAYPFPLAPLPEQRAIVAKIEGLFSDLDKGVSELKAAQAQLKIYRQAVLKKAFEGELTNEWREQQTNLPSADELLEQIQEERQKHYDQQIEEWKLAVQAWEQNGKDGKKPAKPKADKKNASYETEIELDALPASWKWENLGNITSVSGGLTKNSKREGFEKQLPFLRVANVFFNRLDLVNMHYIGIKEDEIARVLLFPGDLLLVEGNGSVSQIGRVAIWKGDIENCVHQNHLIKARPFSSIKSEYLLHFLCSKKGRDLIIHEASSTSGLHTLNLTKVCNLKIPLCSLPEQREIVKEIEARLSVCDEVEQSIAAGLEQAAALRQSILKRAFEGKLLTEAERSACRAEPDYEPAAALLERITN